ncbi:MAG TPA: NlpC/P60 family protein [Solirubrobacteraceae bacterium]|nr:NlpC/P60 family protein [Solirubrobacteraceae bacterium]
MLLATLAVAIPAAGAPPSISQKQQQAQGIIADLNSLDSKLNRAVESYNGARLHFAQTQQAIRTNTRVLAVVRRNLKRSLRNIAARVRALYMQGDQQSTIEILLGAKSLDEVITGIDTAQQVTAEDEKIAREATSFRLQAEARQRNLLADRKKASELLAEATSRRDAIQSGISRRERLLSSVKDEIVRMQEAEQQRQEVIARQVRARLAAQAKLQQAAAAQASPAENAPPPAAPADPASTTANPTPTATTAAALPPSRYSGVVAIAMRYLGIPYTWGGASPATGFDCSGFTMYVYAQIGVSLPHYTGDQWQMGTAVSRDELQPGDLVFFDGLGHEGLYIGNNQFIHAPHTGDVVKISSLTGWYADTYMGARRL